eukprot:GHVR01053544.1.p1 GENE.GHVR01053544.1~~GHVR01053544.1.p1  ORF type:complete len:364 (+),score=32.67 GHVR01053544.1:1093-2184(+)
MKPHEFIYSKWQPRENIPPFATLLVVAKNNLDFISSTRKYLGEGRHSGCSSSTLKKVFGESFDFTNFTHRSTVHSVLLEGKSFFYKIPRALTARGLLTHCALKREHSGALKKKERENRQLQRENDKLVQFLIELKSLNISEKEKKCVRPLEDGEDSVSKRLKLYPEEPSGSCDEEPSQEEPCDENDLMRGAVAKNLGGGEFWEIPVFKKLNFITENSEWKKISVKRLIDLAGHCSRVFQKHGIFHNDMRWPNVVDGQNYSCRSTDESCSATEVNESARFIDWDFAIVIKPCDDKTSDERSRSVWQNHMGNDEILQFIRCAGAVTPLRNSESWKQWENVLHNALRGAFCMEDVISKLEELQRNS